MKTKLKRVSKSTLAVILSIMMVFSTMLVGTISVSAASYDLYSSSDQTGSSGTKLGAFSSSDGSTYTLTYTATATETLYLYIYDGSSSWMCGAADISLNQEVTLYKYGTAQPGHVQKLAVTSGTTYTFTWKPDSSNGKLTATVDSSGGDTSQKYYVRGSGSGLSWDSNGAKEMTKSDDGTYYYFEVTTPSDTVNFKIAKSATGWDYGYSTTAVEGSSINIGVQDNTNFSITPQSSKYYIIFYPGDSIKVQASTTLPGSVTTHIATVSLADGAPAGANAYVSSYTDKDGNPQSGTSSTTSATFKDGTDVTFTAAAVSGYTIAWSGATGTASSDGTTFTVSSANADITVTATYAKKTYTVTAGTSTGGTVTVNGESSATVEENGTVELKAVANTNDGYTFKSWDTTVTGISYNDASSATTTATVTGNATVTAIFEKEASKYYIIGEAVGSWTTSVELEIVYGTTYSHTFNNSSELKKASQFLVSKTTLTDDNVNAQVGTGSGATVSTSGSNLTVSLLDNYTYPITLTYDSYENKLSATATEQAAATYTVTYGVNNASYGSVSAKDSSDNNVASDSKVTSGTSVTFTASPESGYTVGGWYSDADCTNQILGTSTATTYTASNITSDTYVYVKFVESGSVTKNTYKVWAGDGNTTYEMFESPDNSGIYYSSDLVGNGWWFKVEKTASDSTKTYSNSGSSPLDLSSNPITVNTWDSDTKTNNNSYKNTFGSDACLVYNSNDNTVYFVAEIPDDGRATIYAKKGSYNNDRNILGLNYGTTTILNSDASTTLTPTSTDTVHGFSTYKIESGTYVTIRSTIPSTYYKSGEGFYVAGFVVNGETVSITNEQEDKEGNGIFDGYYVVGEEGKIEITPVYFNRTIAAAGDYVYFTVDATDVPTGWGNTTSAYSYYYYDNNTKQYEQDGSWPGQPLLKTSTGTYWTMVSKYYYDNNGTKTTTEFSGVVLSNYGADYVHCNKMGISIKQTYDYNTPAVAIAQGYDMISFSTEYRSAKYNYDVIKPTGDNFAPQAGYTFNPSSYESETGNGWDVLKHYTREYNVDVLGNRVTNDSSLPIYVVSVGNVNTKDQTKVTQVGQWSTMWYVYAKNSDGTYTYITHGNPSEFINPDTDQYKAMNVDAYKGRTTYVTYEQENSLNNSGDRIDGQWYYMKQADLQVTLYAQTQYEASKGNWVFDNTGIAGTALVDGVAPDERGISSKTYAGAGSEATITATNKDGYVFDGWYLVDTKSQDNPSKYEYKKLDNLSSSDTITVTNSMFVVARFTPIAKGNLALTHTNKPGSGLGSYSISAQVKDINGNNVGSLLTGSSVTIKGIRADYSVEITLTTRMLGINKFEGWYMLYDDIYYPFGGEEAPVVKNNTVSYTFTLSADQIFLGNEQLVTTLTYYSNIITVDGTAVLNYQYLDRNNTIKTYTTSVKLTPEYLDKHGYDLKNVDGTALIVENAPAVEDLHKNVKWNIVAANLTYNATTVTLMAEYIEKTYTLTIKDEYADPPTDTKSEIKYNTLITDSSKVTKENPDGLSICASGDNFSYWLVTNTVTGKEVTRTYQKYFNLRIVDDYTITAVYEGTPDNIAILGEPEFTREQYTENGTQYDYLYADFIVSYIAADGTLIKDNPNRFKTGIILEYDTGYKVTANNQTITDDLKFNDAETDLNKVIALENGKNIISDSGSGKQIAYNYVISDNTKYNNMNRGSYYIKFNNKSVSYRYYVMKAYYYVVDNVTGKTYLSKAVYFNLYKIATSSADVN